MDWLVTSLYWYIYIFVLGIIFFPLTQRLFRRFSFDFGYPFVKVLAILFGSYAVFVLGTLRLLPFSQLGIILVIFAFLLINIFIFFKKNKLDVSRSTFYLIIFEELLFLFSFLFWTLIRGQEPSIHSLEKFMDFGFINSILRAKSFPPKDIWYAGFPINYYYFGHLTGAVLIKLTGIKPSVGYNLILATLFALGITQTFSLITNIINIYKPKAISIFKLIFFGLLGAFVINLGGNLHTIYAFTTGYPNDNPIPFWKILSSYHPLTYWYPNATRFIPFTIHEFPSYSYVVADLHGHVFDIPFVLLTLAVLFLLFTNHKKTLNASYYMLNAIFLGFLTAVHYTTNAFDGPIYILLSIIIFFFLFKFSRKLVIYSLILLSTFLLFSLPFSFHFKPFVTGIGVNCSPNFLTDIGRIGPFLFEKEKCQVSPFWMLFVLWGFFWISFILFLLIRRIKGQWNNVAMQCNNFFFLLFSFGTFLIFIPEFFYIKDIYPAHFRANTMFKLGYQAFIMMGIASIFTFFAIKLIERQRSIILSIIFIFFLFFVIIYPFFSIPSYYGKLDRTVDLDGQTWLSTSYPEDKEIIDYLNINVKDQPVILEAQGDSYTDFERISAMTGLPTVAGWWVHEWLWRGSSDVVGKRIPDVITLYESSDLQKTKELTDKYKIKYIIVSKLEKQKYTNLNESKFLQLGRRIFVPSDGIGAIYQIN